MQSGSSDSSSVAHITIADALLATEAAHGGRPALISRHQEIRWTWHDLLSKARSIANGLAALGLTPGDRVGVWSTNCAEWVALQYACALSGLVLVNVNPASNGAASARSSCMKPINAPTTAICSNTPDRERPAACNMPSISARTSGE